MRSLTHCCKNTVSIEHAVPFRGGPSYMTFHVSHFSHIRLRAETSWSWNLTVRIWLMNHAEQLHQFHLCNLAKQYSFSFLIVLKHQLYAETSPHSARGKMFSTFSGPGNDLKIHMRNFLTSSPQLIRSHVQTLWHSTAFTTAKRHFITFQFGFHYV